MSVGLSIGVLLFIIHQKNQKNMGFRKNRGGFRKGRSRSRGRRGGRKTKRIGQYFVGRGGVRM